MGTLGAEHEGGEQVAKKRVYVRIAADLHRRLKAEAAMAGKNIEELAEELLAEGIEANARLTVINGGHGEI